VRHLPPAAAVGTSSHLLCTHLLCIAKLDCRLHCCPAPVRHVGAFHFPCCWLHPGATYSQAGNAILLLPLHALMCT
jgi:hypothetical protein